VNWRNVKPHLVERMVETLLEQMLGLREPIGQMVDVDRLDVIEAL